MNSVKLSGYVANNPSSRYDKNGELITNFPLCVIKSFKKDEHGFRQADFFPISTFRKTAELCRDYLTKGMVLVITEGHIERNTDSSTGVTYTNIVADKIEYYNTGKNISTQLDAETVQDFDFELSLDS